MEKHSRIIIGLVTIIGSVGDIISIIIGIQTMNISIPLSVISSVALISVIIALFLRYRERSEFIKFIQYMFDNDFNVLPKVCLAVDKAKEKIGFKAKSLNIKYNYIMPEMDYSRVDKDTYIEYEDVIEYNFEFENKTIPKEFVCYLGNVNAGETLHVKQKHGCQTHFVDIPFTNAQWADRPEATINRYSWQILKQNITNDITFPISFQFQYLETAKANDSDTLVFYPRQYAKEIEKVTFEIDLSSCKKNALRTVELHKIWKDKNSFKQTPIKKVSADNNAVLLSIQPEKSKYEAYYIIVTWELV